MIDESVLDKIIPVPDTEALKQEIQEELEGEGFIITNFNTGGIFYTIMMICILIHRELLQLARVMINSLFITHADGDWLEIKAADYSKTRKEAKKAQGYVTINRSNYETALYINKGHMFKTLPDANGTELKFYAIENSVIPAGIQTYKILVEAENTGTDYNVSTGKIIISMIYLDGVSNVTNNPDWLFTEGSDIEDLESLRSRCKSSYSELAERTIEEKLKNVAEGVNGVLAAKVNAQHPRGQGTVDVIITGSAGEATEELLANVDSAITYLKGTYEDFLVKSSLTVAQNFELVIYLAEQASIDGVMEQAETLITSMMKLTKRELNILYRDNIIAVLSSNIIDYKKTDIIQPATDVILTADKVIVLGTINITVRRVGQV